MTGLTDISGKKIVLLEVTPPGKQVQKHILEEGEAAGGVEVIEIDVEIGKAKVQVAGKESTLTLEPDKTSVPHGMPNRPVVYFPRR